MERYFIYAIGLYALVVAIYMLWERSVKRKKNAARKKSYNPFRSAPKEDIIGKSKFTLRHSRPQATTQEISEKGIGNTAIFADENRRTTPAAVLPPESGTGAVPDNSEDNSGEIDIVIENEPEGEFETEETGDLDTWETEREEDEIDDETAGSRATGIGFEELAGMAHTVANPESATADQREEAGRVLAEVRMTEIINQVAPDEPKRKVVSSLMDDYFTAYYRRTEAQPDPVVKAPADFNVRGFA